jgi:hypothetical protein
MFLLPSFVVEVRAVREYQDLVYLNFFFVLLCLIHLLLFI